MKTSEGTEVILTKPVGKYLAETVGLVLSQDGDQLLILIGKEEVTIPVSFVKPCGVVTIGGRSGYGGFFDIFQTVTTDFSGCNGAAASFRVKPSSGD